MKVVIVAVNLDPSFAQMAVLVAIHIHKADNQ